MAFCAKCKNSVTAGDTFCRHCGRMLSQSPVSPNIHREEPFTTQNTSALSILALVLAFVIPIVGFILSFFALAEFRKNPNLKGKGFAWAAFFLPLAMIIILLIVVLIRSFSG